MSLLQPTDTTQPRRRTPARVIRNRARHRATALLLEEFPDRFQVLLSQEQRVATIEAAMLLATGPNDSDNVVLLRPGVRLEGQTPEDRIDVGRCTRCQTSHDAGHVCPRCGS